MGQVSAFLRRYGRGWMFWCPGCKAPHAVGDGWEFNGRTDCPTWSPSILVTGGTQKDEKGEIKRDAQGKAIPLHCHSFVRDGMIEFLSDSHHELAGRTVALPPLPTELQDYGWQKKSDEPQGTLL